MAVFSLLLAISASVVVAEKFDKTPITEIVTAGKGEIHDFTGPACSGLEECMKYAQEQAAQEKMDKMEAEYKAGFSGKGLVGARYGRGQRNTISTSFDF